MSEKYIPLYRKYRPKNLAEVVGQEHVKKALSNAIGLNKISHAYLFTGPRGTGKTSIARILAKSLNCQQGPTLTPCEQCPSCLDIKNSNPMDVIEIDAASNRSVEAARNILEKIQYVATNGKFKIYIIDEVHMLTKEAFNTLLKTLEEPPENVVFILATTEPQKVLETITSRCQRFDFRRITTEDIVNHLKNIAKLEKIKIEDDALFTIAKNAAGGMRDSLALLDQISVLDNSRTITTDDINKLLGRLSFDVLNKLAGFIIESQPQNAIEFLEQIYNSGNEPTQILTNFLGYLKNLLIVKNCSGLELLISLTQLNESQIKSLKSQSENIDTHQITFLIEKVAYYIKELKVTTSQHLWLEIAIIDMANLAQNTSLLELQDRISRLEGSGTAPAAPRAYSPAPIAPTPIANSAPAKPAVAASQVAPSAPKAKSADETEEIKISEAKIEQKTQTEPAPTQVQEDEPAMPISRPAQKDSVHENWLGLLQNISSTPTVSLLTQHTTPLEVSDEKVVIGCKENFLKLVSGDTKRMAIEEGARKFFGKDVHVIIKVASADDFAHQEKKNLAFEKSQSAQPTKSSTSSSQEQVKTVKQDEIDDETDFVEHELEKKKKKQEKYVPSDQVNMVMKLFDGKYID